MSIYIKDMKMPKAGCLDIRIHSTGDIVITNRDDKIYKGIEVPEHGRLIDADALKDNDDIIHKYMLFGGQVVYSQGAIDNAPTIIPADSEVWICKSGEDV